MSSAFGLFHVFWLGFRRTSNHDHYRPLLLVCLPLILIMVVILYSFLVLLAEYVLGDHIWSVVAIRITFRVLLWSVGFVVCWLSSGLSLATCYIGISRDSWSPVRYVEFTQGALSCMIICYLWIALLVAMLPPCMQHLVTPSLSVLPLSLCLLLQQAHTHKHTFSFFASCIVFICYF